VTLGSSRREVIALNEFTIVIPAAYSVAPLALLTVAVDTARPEGEPLEPTHAAGKALGAPFADACLARARCRHDIRRSGSREGHLLGQRDGDR
jgi:hypothetical protein